MALGIVFIVSGMDKLISPYQNFLYAIQGYQLLPTWVESTTAHVFPWVEFITGVFLVLGLWVQFSLKAAGVMFCIFITVVGQAILRKLPLEHCGCFGAWIVLSLRAVIVMDSCLFLVVVFLLRNFLKAASFSLDSHFSKS